MRHFSVYDKIHTPVSAALLLLILAGCGHGSAGALASVGQSGRSTLSRGQGQLSTYL